MKKYALVLFLSACILGVATGCDAVQFSALNNPTATPSRTPRPTFTPRPSATAIPSDTPTAAASDTPAVTDTAQAQPSDTPAVKPQATSRPRPVQPTNTSPPPKPALPVFPDASMSPLGGQAAYACYQEGSFYEVIIYAKRVGQPGKRLFAPGLTFGAFSGGTLLKDYGGKSMLSKTDDGGMSGYAYGSNCQRSSSILDPDRYNGKLDVGDAVRAGTTSLDIRFVVSANDLTPQSQAVNIQFPKPGRWWIYFGVQ